MKRRQQATETTNFLLSVPPGTGWDVDKGPQWYMTWAESRCRLVSSSQAL